MLDESDCPGTHKYGSGCLAVYQGRVGISFQGVQHPERVVWQTQRRYLLESQLSKFVKLSGKPSDVSQEWYRLPVLPRTFVPLQLDRDSEDVMRELILISDLVDELMDLEASEPNDEPCDKLRARLRERYAGFVGRWGALSDYQSYATTAFGDVRLNSLTLQLEQGGKTAEILTRRCTYATRHDNKTFYDGSERDRVTSAYAYCRVWYGKVDVDLIAEKCGLDSDLVEVMLLELGMVMRDPNPNDTFAQAEENVAA